MQKHELVSLQVEHLIVELSYCTNDLQGFSQHLSMADAKQVELNLSKLETLISFVRNRRNLKLAAV